MKFTQCKLFFSYKTAKMSLVANALLLAALSATVQAQNTNCVRKGGSAHLFIEHTNAGCRTLLTEGGQSKPIAWAQSHPQLCINVAEKVMARSGRAAWVCDAGMTGSRPSWPAHALQEKPSKKPAQYSSTSDYAILKSSER